ncbi:GntR family transcriptional regulator [Palleronia sp. LCG004]|uniref:GntR family transcriptional regulator n=1 Tax=Palleronia sp. LCG004 TaxID=3079304 RepID=UPI0029435838|nr:GntR family transcriptional regulator [Palleronia sp. LCG004]WOI57714.1 GntR family transcriptional regulator [Palleronia sp. LCG004]
MTMLDTVIRRETMADQIVRAMRVAILSGEFEPGEPMTETALSARFGVSRGPMREAMRRLIDEGLLVSVAFTGTRVLDLSLKDIDDIYAMRICLERFAFEQIWDRRDARFRAELAERHQSLFAAIDAGDDVQAIDAELHLHGLCYEACGNALLLESWRGIRGRLQLYWAAHHRAHGITGPKRESHDDYVRLALGADLEHMRAEIDTHMRLGLEKTKSFVQTIDKPQEPYQQERPT